jgi:hypothetical protein
LPNELSELGYPGDEAMFQALKSAFSEARPSHHRPDSNPQETPSHIFVWESKFFRCRMYLKFKLRGTQKKPVLWVYSCHPAYF